MRTGRPSDRGLIALRVTVFRPSRMAHTIEVLNKIGFSIPNHLQKVHQIRLHQRDHRGKELVQHIRPDQAGLPVLVT